MLAPPELQVKPPAAGGQDARSAGWRVAPGAKTPDNNAAETKTPDAK
jgi:hypothetical protein